MELLPGYLPDLGPCISLVNVSTALLTRRYRVYVVVYSWQLLLETYTSWYSLDLLQLLGRVIT